VAAAAAAAAASGLFAVEKDAHSALDRRNRIYTNNRFTPRTDFPPTVMLFKAMKRKYGPQYSRYEIPDTAAACWALVRSMEKGQLEAAANEIQSKKAQIGKTRKKHNGLGKNADLNEPDERVYESVGGRRFDGGIEAAGTSKHFELRYKTIKHDPLERRLAQRAHPKADGKGGATRYRAHDGSIEGLNMRKYATSPEPRGGILVRPSPKRDANGHSQARKIASPDRRPGLPPAAAAAYAVAVEKGNSPPPSREPSLDGATSPYSDLGRDTEDSEASDRYPRLSQDLVKGLPDEATPAPNASNSSNERATPEAEFVFPINTFSVVAGLKITQAHYFLKSSKAVGQLLSALADPGVNTLPVAGIPGTPTSTVAEDGFAGGPTGSPSEPPATLPA